MNKGVIIAIVIGVIAALAAAGVFISNRNNSPAQEEVTADSLTSSSNHENTTLLSLLHSTENQRCVYTDSEQDFQGEIYTGGGKLRGNFASTPETSELNFHIISDGEFIYAWSDEENALAIKASLAEVEMLGNFAQENDTDALDFSAEVDYTCSPWTVDTSIFTVPSGVEFSDYSSLLKSFSELTPENTGEINTDTKAIQCEACDSLPEGSVAQCKQVLGC